MYSAFRLSININLEKLTKTGFVVHGHIIAQFEPLNKIKLFFLHIHIQEPEIDQIWHLRKLSINFHFQKHLFWTIIISHVRLYRVNTS